VNAAIWAAKLMQQKNWVIPEGMQQHRPTMQNPHHMAAYPLSAQN
jgi:hypothetical protein